MPIPLACSLQPPLAERAIYILEPDPAERARLTGALEAGAIRNPCRLFSRGDEIIQELIGVLRGACPPLLCLLRCRRPAIDCLDVLRWIRLHDALREVSVVILSSGEDPVRRHDALQLGAQCFAEEPLGPMELREIVHEAEAVCIAASGHSAFDLPCNLLLSSGTAAPVIAFPGSGETAV
jgi:CheY-like chemotaxis protein